ncbi:hypothetical protein D3880_00300 [Pseudomonas cavernae]|uniref:Transmembrane protein n=1 Tax=Pseudomonas cavernae TaxID=2320867 RepID=A0A385Z9P9_9PSED|nr:hypothetical protein [Pseudomonas cavernae]AYC34987.1 hypothetical protein D3880_00300 [Pseudomonas cavernae]
MGVAMNPATNTAEVRPRGRGRGRLQLILLLAVVIGPMVLASAMYYGRFWVPEGRSYHGSLIGNGQSRADLGVQVGTETRWQLLVTAPAGCAADCRELVYLARQIQIGLGREASRATHALAAAEPLAADYQAVLQRDYPQLQRYPLNRQQYDQASEGATGPHLWIVDPHGNLVLRYDNQVKGKAVLNDLRLLLKLSNIG